MTQERQRRPKEISSRRRYVNARINLDNILNDQETPLVGGRLQRALFAVEQTALALKMPRSLNNNERELVTLAKKAEAEARRRGQPATAKLMELAETDIRDRFAIKRGEYPLVEVRTQLPQQEGGQVTYIRVYQASEVKLVFGPPSTEPIPLE